MLFIGDSSEEQRELIRSRLATFSFSPFSLMPNRFFFFNRRILYLSLRPSEELFALKAKIDVAIQRMGRSKTKVFSSTQNSEEMSAVRI